MKKLLFIAMIGLAACGQMPGQMEAPQSAPGAWKSVPGLYAVLNTDKGTIVCRLYDDKTPKTVDNFVGLASGTKEWLDPRDGQRKKAPLYNGTVFFRIIPGFMIQGGDPINRGNGGPGYQFEDEFVSSLTFDRPGLLAMANAGPNTNGSQFFITDTPRNGIPLPSHLNGHHTIFGEVVEGLDVVSAIADVPANGDHAVDPAVLRTLEIQRIEQPAKTPAAR
jgi:peptidyl-prolyl cis-trans isomerase A (cyclophilin A)